MNSIASTPTARAPSALGTILTAGIVSAAGDLLFACVFYGIRNGLTPLRIFQAIGTGWFGRDSFQMGWTSGTIGFFSHFGILIVAAAIYFYTARRLSLLVRQPLLSGIVYGAAVFVVMNYVVVPLSASPAGHRALDATLGELASHLLLVGLSTSYIVRRFYRS